VKGLRRRGTLDAQLNRFLTSGSRACRLIQNGLRLGAIN
jgi:hypothetical protein